jgi:hypothetical protein
MSKVSLINGSTRRTTVNTSTLYNPQPIKYPVDFLRALAIVALMGINTKRCPAQTIVVLLRIGDETLVVYYLRWYLTTNRHFSDETGFKVIELVHSGIDYYSDPIVAFRYCLSKNWDTISFMEMYRDHQGQCSTLVKNIGYSDWFLSYGCIKYDCTVNIDSVPTKVEYDLVEDYISFLTALDDDNLVLHIKLCNTLYFSNLKVVVNCLRRHLPLTHSDMLILNECIKISTVARW